MFEQHSRCKRVVRVVALLLLERNRVFSAFSLTVCLSLSPVYIVQLQASIKPVFGSVFLLSFRTYRGGHHPTEILQPQRLFYASRVHLLL